MKTSKQLNAIIISDSHGLLLTFEKELIEMKEKLIFAVHNFPYDCILCLGDIQDKEYEYIIEINKKDKPIIAVNGNHYDPQTINKLDKIINLNGNKIIINQYSIAGIEGVFKYNEYTTGFTQEESLLFAKNMPNRSEILLSHDAIYNKNENPLSRNLGLKGISYYLKKNKCFLHLHGHHHIVKEEQIHKTKSIGCYGINTIEIRNHKVKIKP